MEKIIFEDLPSTKTPLSAENLNKMQDNLIDLIYPIGSIFLSTNAMNPTSYLGGTWNQIKDVFLLSAGEIYEAGTRGGEATHTLTVKEIPAHTHDLETFKVGTTQNKGYVSDLKWSTKAEDNLWTGYTTPNGGGEAHNNMPPYLAVYMWERIS